MIRFRSKLQFLLAVTLCLAASLSFALSPASAAKVAVAPAEVYGALPGARAARLSPNGKLLALIVPDKGRDTLLVWDLDGKRKPVVIPTGEFEPEWFVWKTDNRLIGALRFFSIRDPRRPTVDTRLFAIDADGTNAKELVSPEHFKVFIPQIQDKIVSLLPDDPEHILIELPAFDRTQMRPGETTGIAQIGSLNNAVKYPEVVQVDINTGRLRTLLRQQGRFVAWRADAAGNIRIGQSLYEKQVDFQVRAGDGEPWSSIQSYELNKGRVFSPLAFVEGNPERLYVLSNHAGGRTALYEFDTRSNTYVRTVADNPRSGIEAIVRDGRLLGYRLSHEASPVYIDANFAAEAKVINRALPDSRNDIVDRSKDGKRVLVQVRKGNEPADYWLLDRTSGKAELTPVAEAYPKLEPEQIAQTRVTSYKARDGLEIPALVTFPPGYQPAASRPLPFVVLPHGGPTAHDVTGFDYLVQFIASRGYGVLQPQFRGSTGYGAAFEVAGLGQWGQKMQDDVTDGTRWLVQQKLADPARIVIVGASYGGYSALIGVVKEPELYRAAAAIAPVTDLNLLVDSNWNFLFSDINQPRIGTDSAILDQNSPASHVDRIRVPLLLVHGRKDYTVPVEQTERLVKALDKAGKPFNVVYLDEGDHFLSRGGDRLATLKALEKFLAENLRSP